MGFHSQNGALSHYTQPPSIDAPLASDMCDPSLFYFSSSGPYISPFFSLNISRTDTVRQCHLSETLVSHLRPDALSLSALGPHPTIKHFQLKIIKSKKKPSGISLPFPSGGWPFLRRAARLFSKKKVVHKFRIKVSPDVVGNFTERSGTKRYGHWNRNKRPRGDSFHPLYKQTAATTTSFTVEPITSFSANWIFAPFQTNKSPAATIVYDEKQTNHPCPNWISARKMMAHWQPIGRQSDCVGVWPAPIHSHTAPITCAHTQFRLRQTSLVTTWPTSTKKCLKVHFKSADLQTFKVSFFENFWKENSIRQRSFSPFKKNLIDFTERDKRLRSII